jgi:hypothetical protein
MSYILTGDQLRSALRKLGDIERQLGQDSGYPHDPEKLLMALQAVGEGKFQAVVGGLSYCQKNVPHLIPDWVKEVVEDVEPTIVEGAKLSFPGFLQDDDNGRIDGPIMRNRAVEMVANKGLSDVPALLGKDGKGLETIPVELRGGGIYIVLTGTVLRSSHGDLCVPGLYWGGGEWYLDFRGLAYDWHGNARLVSCE